MTIVGDGKRRRLSPSSFPACGVDARGTNDPLSHPPQPTAAGRPPPHPVSIPRDAVPTDDGSARVERDHHDGGGGDVPPPPSEADAAAAARSAALSEADAFHSSFFGECVPRIGSSPSSVPPRKFPLNERSCVGGHSGTIYGLSFSPDGKFLATASQDSTVRVWEVSNHRLAGTIREGLDDGYECLRVAWWDGGSVEGIGGAGHADNTDDRGCSGGEGRGREEGRPEVRGEEECKYILATGGADGVVKLWSGRSDGTRWVCVGAIDHRATPERPESKEERSQDREEEAIEEDPPQIYALQFIPQSCGGAGGEHLLMTAPDDRIHFWRMPSWPSSSSSAAAEIPKCLRRPLRTVRFAARGGTRNNDLDGGSPSSSFGGDRNPGNDMYVFDAAHSPASGCLGAALSDGTCRLLTTTTMRPPSSSEGEEKGADGERRKEEFDEVVLELPGAASVRRKGSHLTSISWDASGTRLATCVADGRVALWSVAVDDETEAAAARRMMRRRDEVMVGPSSLKTRLVAVLEGGHQPGRPLFGAKYCGGSDVGGEKLLLTWGVDGKICLWDSYSSEGHVTNPLCTLLARPEYPIYALDLLVTSQLRQEEKTREHSGGGRTQSSAIAIGGGIDGGFLGVLAYIYDVTGKVSDLTV